MKSKLIALLVLMMLVTLSANAQYSRIKNILNHDHDMSAVKTDGFDSWYSDPASATVQKQVCWFCHVPHQRSRNVDPLAAGKDPNGQTPLWNHVLSSTASYNKYSSPTFDALGTDIADVGPSNVAGSATVSNLCLSCHDGTMGVNTVYRGMKMSPDDGARHSPAMTRDNGGGSVDFVAMDTPAKVKGSHMIGDIWQRAAGLRQDHPINFTYDAALAAKSISLIAPVAAPAGGTAVPTSGTGTGWLPLYAGKLQCATCHDPHDNTLNGTGDEPFLRNTRIGSAICFDCHGK